MPIKEIVSFAMGVMMVVALSSPLHFRENLRRIEFSILKETSRVDNWGNPSIWAHVKHQKLKTTKTAKDSSG
jgi:hypothetical protein